MERNGLSEEAATRRVAVQPSGREYVDHAHVIIGTYCTTEFTVGQIEKAWVQLMERISSSD